MSPTDLPAQPGQPGQPFGPVYFGSFNTTADMINSFNLRAGLLMRKLAGVRVKKGIPSDISFHDWLAQQTDPLSKQLFDILTADDEISKTLDEYSDEQLLEIPIAQMPLKLREWAQHYVRMLEMLQAWIKANH